MKTSTTAGRALALVGAILAAGCATVAQVTNLAQPGCAAEFRAGVSAILAGQGEAGDAADALAGRAVSSLATESFGPRPFLIASASGTDYEFFVQKKANACLLRLYGRQHGFVSYTNNLTWIDTRPLTRCECTD